MELRLLLSSLALHIWRRRLLCRVLKFPQTELLKFPQIELLKEMSSKGPDSEAPRPSLLQPLSATTATHCSANTSPAVMVHMMCSNK